MIGWSRRIKMVAIKARFDGKKIVIPAQIRGGPPREVLLVFDDLPKSKTDSQLWLKAQEEAFAKVWDNPEDAVYDSL
jgi:hypothetical protein